MFIDENSHKDVFKYLLKKIEEIFEKKNYYNMINTAIGLIGIFSDSIVRFLGNNILHKYLWQDLLGH